MMLRSTCSGSHFSLILACQAGSPPPLVERSLSQAVTEEDELWTQHIAVGNRTDLLVCLMTCDKLDSRRRRRKKNHEMQQGRHKCKTFTHRDLASSFPRYTYIDRGHELAHVIQRNCVVRQGPARLAGVGTDSKSLAQCIFNFNGAVISCTSPRSSSHRGCACEPKQTLPPV